MPTFAELFRQSFKKNPMPNLPRMNYNYIMYVPIILYKLTEHEE